MGNVQRNIQLDWLVRVLLLQSFSPSTTFSYSIVFNAHGFLGGLFCSRQKLTAVSIDLLTFISQSTCILPLRKEKHKKARPAEVQPKRSLNSFGVYNGTVAEWRKTATTNQVYLVWCPHWNSQALIYLHVCMYRIHHMFELHVRKPWKVEVEKVIKNNNGIGFYCSRFQACKNVRVPLIHSYSISMWQEKMR